MFHVKSSETLGFEDRVICKSQNRVHLLKGFLCKARMCDFIEMKPIFNLTVLEGYFELRETVETGESSATKFLKQDNKTSL